MAVFSEVLATEADELAVLSVIAAKTTAGPQFVHGSLIICPTECAQSTWLEWSNHHRTRPGRMAPDLPASYRYEAETCLVARQVLNPQEARAWLEDVVFMSECSPDLVANGTAPELPHCGEIPSLLAHLDPPASVIHVLQGTDTPAGSLAQAASRPLRGALWPLHSAVDRVTLPRTPEFDGLIIIDPAMDLAGMHLTPDWVRDDLQTPQGLLVARLERRAWITDVQGEAEMEHLHVSLGWDPDRIDIGDLELQLEEYLDNGELVLCERTHLDDLDTDSVHDLGRCRISLRTLGRHLRHSVTLTNSEGDLLDRHGPHPLAEQVSVSISINGEKLPPIVSGETRPSPELEERMQRSAQLAAEMDEIKRTAAERRILREANAGRETLRRHLQRARGTLRVLDPYFGRDEADWALLGDLPMSSRVLLGKLVEADAPLAPGTEARIVSKGMLHDRMYLWNGGGLTIGGSLNTLGKAPVFVARLRPADAAAWSSYFDELWESLDDRVVPRRSGVAERTGVGARARVNGARSSDC